MVTSANPHRLQQLIAFIRLGRYSFAGAGFVLFGFGAALAAFYGHSIHWGVYLLGQLIVTCTQLMMHYANDYYDYLADVANQTPTQWSGGSRVLPRGELPLTVAINTALALAGIALMATAYLMLHFKPGALTLLIILPAIFLSWIYNAPPLRTNARGLGEITGVLVVSFLTPLLGYTLQAGDLPSPVLLAFVPLMFLQANMLFSVNMPDIEGDLLVNKRTLVARLGRAQTALLYQVLLVLTYLSLPLLMLLGLPPRIAAGAALPLPLGIYLLFRMARGDWQQVEQRNSLAFQSIALLMVTLLGELASVLLALR